MRYQNKAYLPLQGINQDTTSLFLAEGECVDCQNLRLLPDTATLRPGCKQLGSSLVLDTLTVATAVDWLHFYTFKSPTGAEILFGFTKDNIYKYEDTSATWTGCLNTAEFKISPKTVTKLDNDVTFWHTTAFISTEVGATLVAAGSCPPKENEAESDMVKRILLYYDSTAGTFKTISLLESMDVTDEVTGDVGPASPSIVDLDALDLVTGGNTLVAGTFSVGTAELGTLATAETAITVIGGVDCYLLRPVNTSAIELGTSSYIRVDGTAGKLKFLTDTYSGLPILFGYTYRAAQALKPRYVWNFYNRILMGGIAETVGGTTAYYPWRLAWTNPGYMTRTTYTDFTDVIDTDVSEIMGGDFLGPNLTLLKRKSIYTVNYGNATTPVVTNCIWKSGCISGRTLQTLDNVQYFLGESTVFRYDGSSLRSIAHSDSGPARVANAIFKGLNFGYVRNCFGSLDHGAKEYWLWTTNSAIRPTTAWVYNISGNAWYKFTYTKPVGAVGYFRTNNLFTIDSLVGTIGDQNWTFERGLEDRVNSSPVFGCADGVMVGETYIQDSALSSDYGLRSSTTWLAGTLISSYMVTKDFTFNDVHNQDRLQRVEVEAIGGGITVGVSGEFATAVSGFVHSQTLAYSSTWLRSLYHPDVTGYQFRLRLDMTGFIQIRLILLYALPLKFTNR